MNFTRETAAAYLSAMIDGEGYIPIQNPDSRALYRVVISNTDPGIIRACLDAFKVLGIEPRVSEREREGRKPLTDLLVHDRVQLQRLYDAVQLGSEQKASKFDAMMQRYA